MFELNQIQLLRGPKCLSVGRTWPRAVHWSYWLCCNQQQHSFFPFIICPLIFQLLCVTRSDTESPQERWYYSTDTCKMSDDIPHCEAFRLFFRNCLCCPGWKIQKAHGSMHTVSALKLFSLLKGWDTEVLTEAPLQHLWKPYARFAERKCTGCFFCVDL